MRFAHCRTLFSAKALANYTTTYFSYISTYYLLSLFCDNLFNLIEQTTLIGVKLKLRQLRLLITFLRNNLLKFHGLRKLEKIFCFTKYSFATKFKILKKKPPYLFLEFD